jgi:hypothetical protein
MAKSKGAVFQMPLFTCLFYIDGGGGNGGRLILLNQSRTAEDVEPRANVGWVAAPIPGDLLCFDGNLLHAVLPGVLGLREPDQPPVEDSAALDELRSLVRNGQKRMSLNLAFWEKGCLHDSPICQLKDSSRESSKVWAWEKSMPTWGKGLFSSAPEVNPTQLNVPSVDNPWVYDPAGWQQEE